MNFFLSLNIYDFFLSLNIYEKNSNNLKIWKKFRDPSKRKILENWKKNR
jgi:hypothetical protein